MWKRRWYGSKLGAPLQLPSQKLRYGGSALMLATSHPRSKWLSLGFVGLRHLRLLVCQTLRVLTLFALALQFGKVQRNR